MQQFSTIVATCCSARAKSLDGQSWATVAVLVDKLPMRGSSSGKSYSLWRLSDLGAAGKQVTGPPQSKLWQAHRRRRPASQDTLELLCRLMLCLTAVSASTVLRKPSVYQTAQPCTTPNWVSVQPRSHVC